MSDLDIFDMETTPEEDEKNKKLMQGLILAGLAFLFNNTSKDKKYKLSEEEENKLSLSLEKELDISLSDNSIKNISKAIYNARNEFAVTKKSTTAKDFKRQITKFENTCNKLKGFYEVNSKTKTEDNFTLTLFTYSLFKNQENNCFLDLLKNLDSVLKECEELKKEVTKEKFNSKLKTEIRHKLLLEVLQIFYKEGIKATKYTEGKFAKVLPIIFDSFKYRDNKDNFIFSIPVENYNIINRAINEFEPRISIEDLFR